MNPSVPESLAVIAGKGAYPRLLAESARRQGVRHLFAVAFKKETDKSLAKLFDHTAWINMGQLQRLREVLRESGLRHVVMAGLIKPTHLFRARPDAGLRSLLAGLRLRNAQTIFGAIGDLLKADGFEVLPASAFMEKHMPAAGLLTRRAPTAVEASDIELGLSVVRETSDLDIGQTVVVKEGTVLAVEAFEGTDETLRRAGRLGGAGAVIVKLAKKGHDMRFDIPVIGSHTIKVMRKIRASTLAVEAGRCILLERERILDEANRAGLCITAFEQALVRPAKG